MQHTRLRSLLVVALGASVLAIAPAAIPVARAADNPTFHGLPPARLMDTRPGQPTVDGAFAGGGPITTDGTRSVTVVGRGGVPATGAGSVALNVTATNTTSSGYLTVYPAGAARPTASNLNVTPGITIPNMVITPIGTGGQITVYNSSGNTDVIVDVLGWFPATGGFTPLTPARLVDTRLGHPTIDGASAGFGAIPGTATYTVFAGGRGGVAPAGTVKAVALNVTVTNPSIAGYLTVFPPMRPGRLHRTSTMSPGKRSRTW